MINNRNNRDNSVSVVLSDFTRKISTNKFLVSDLNHKISADEIATSDFTGKIGAQKFVWTYLCV